MPVSPKDISFVVQGGIAEDLTQQCLRSIRAHFPEATIILSTWIGSDTAGLVYDELVLSEDPGCFRYNRKPSSKPNNVNRQIVSTREGLRRVKTPYAFKIRTDFQISGASFLKYWDAYPAAGELGGLFRHKVLACCYFTRNPADPRNPYWYPFHLSDVAFFGETRDLLDLFDIPLMPKEEEFWGKGKKSSFVSNRYVPEQYIFVNFLRRRGHRIDFDYYEDLTPENIAASEKYIASNFVLLTFDQFELSSPKKHFSILYNAPSFHTCYTHNEWKALYARYADPHVVLSVEDPERSKIERHYMRYRWLRRLAGWLTIPVWPKERRRRMRTRLREFLLGEENI